MAVFLAELEVIKEPKNQEPAVMTLFHIGMGSQDCFFRGTESHD